MSKSIFLGSQVLSFNTAPVSNIYNTGAKKVKGKKLFIQKLGIDLRKLYKMEILDEYYALILFS